MVGSPRSEWHCFRCTGRWFDEEAHSYLLGIYLGDGCLSRHPSDVFKQRIACDLKYPEIINEIATHIVLAQANDEVGFVVAEGCVEAYSYWKHWICLFPQHGTGKKHERLIELDHWQQEIVESHPKALVRGLIQSDGNRHANPITRRASIGNQALPLHPIHVHECLRRHSPNIHRCPRQARSPLDTNDRSSDLSSPTIERGISRPLCRSQALTGKMRASGRSGGTGRLSVLKRPCPSWRVGSNPTSGTSDVGDTRSISIECHSR